MNGPDAFAIFLSRTNRGEEYASAASVSMSQSKMSVLMSSAHSSIAGCPSHADNMIPHPLPVDLPAIGAHS